MKGPPKRIVIVGGGSAGWMAASLLHHAWDRHGTKITLLESNDIGIIGVGEGSTPFLRQFFQQLEIPESEWMPYCSATYKCGIRFPEWTHEKGHRSYFHPFFSQLDLTTAEAFFHNCSLRRRRHSAVTHPDNFFVSAALARTHRGPKPAQALPFVPDYAYHFDAGRLGEFLRNRAIALGVEHLIGTVDGVSQNDQGDIVSLETEQQGKIVADFFVDCSGFAGLLINQCLGERFHSYRNNLFNDSAIALATAIDTKEPIPSQTVSTALKFGWVWKIPLTSRYGNGYVYSSEFVSAEVAERELRAHLGEAAEGVEARHLKMRVGRVDNHWSKNCLAVGLSQGFIEPLEATALMLIQFTVQYFIQLVEQGDFTDRYRTECNHKINVAFEGVRDYVVAHYQLSKRDDSDYWIENRNHSHRSANLSAILDAWDHGEDFEATLTRHAKTLVYLRPNWYCILAGMGRFSQSTRTTTTRQAASSDKTRAYCEEIARNFPSHRQQLQQTYGEAWVDNHRAVI